jgi:hypothetical protein
MSAEAGGVITPDWWTQRCGYRRRPEDPGPDGRFLRTTLDELIQLRKLINVRQTAHYLLVLRYREGEPAAAVLAYPATC